jgi:hypothetical protein
MNWLSKTGFALLALGALIFAGYTIRELLKVLFVIHVWYIEIAIVAIILGFILMLLAAVYDRYKLSKTEEVHKKV